MKTIIKTLLGARLSLLVTCGSVARAAVENQILRLLQTSVTLTAVAFLTQIAAAQNGATGKAHIPGFVHPPVHVRQTGAQPAATLTPTGLSPAQVRQAYGFDQLPASIDGTGQTIAIIDAYGDLSVTSTTTGHGHNQTTTTTITDNTETDWTTFCNEFGLPTTGLTVVYPQGTNSGSSGNWTLETALDIEWAHAIAPGANILLVIACNSSSGNLLSAVDYAVANGADVVSMSWGGGEFTAEVEAALDVHFNHPGVIFVAASGDSGEFGDTGVLYPAASPYVLSVGGTQLTNDNGLWSETAWSGSGGGISQSEPMPVFQNGWQQFLTGNMRSVPDVSYQGGPNPGVSTYVTPYGGWIQVYGTSVGAPQWAALIALANSARTSGNLTDANPALYSIAGTGTTPPNINESYLLDITSGTNGSDLDDFAISGYDFVTGLGSPSANNLVPALASWVQNPDFSLSVSPASATVPPEGGIATYSIAINRLGGFADAVDLSAASSPALPAGTTASLDPNPSTADSSTLNLSVPANTPVGSYVLTITGSGTTSGLTRTALAGLEISSAPTVASVASVVSITYAASGGNKHILADLLVTFTVQDDLGEPVAGASVAAELYLNGSLFASVNGNTLSDGTVTFTSKRAPLGTYTVVVNNVSTTGLTWDGQTPDNSYDKTQ